MNPSCCLFGTWTIKGAEANFYALCAGMKKFPELSSYNVFISEPHRELHMKGSWLRDQKSVSCWAGSISCSCRIFTASVCCPVTGYQALTPFHPFAYFFPNFIYSGFRTVILGDF